MKATKKCFGCKQDFLREELIDYAGTQGTIMHSYCTKCLHEKQARDHFSDTVCQIFGLKQPGPRIWTERKRLIRTYGYTDNTIVDCLRYLYEVEKVAKLVQSLCLVKPSTVDRMLRYKNSQEYQSYKIAGAMNTEYKEYVVPIAKKIEKREEWNPDDWLEDEE